MRSIRLLSVGLGLLALSGACDERSNPMMAGLALDAAGGGTATFNITPGSVTLNEGQTAALTLNSARPLGPYTWTTNAPGVATVSGDGVVTAIGPGVATITVTSSVDRTVSARTIVTVRSGGGTTGGGTGTGTTTGTSGGTGSGSTGGAGPSGSP